MSNISNNTPYITPTQIFVNVNYCSNQLLNVRSVINPTFFYAITVAPKPCQNKNLFLGTRDGRTPALRCLSYFLTGRIILSVSTSPTSPLATAPLHGNSQTTLLGKAISETVSCPRALTSTISRREMRSFTSTNLPHLLNQTTFVKIYFTILFDNSKFIFCVTNENYIANDMEELRAEVYFANRISKGSIKLTIFYISSILI